MNADEPPAVESNNTIIKKRNNNKIIKKKNENKKKRGRCMRTFHVYVYAAWPRKNERSERKKKELGRSE